ncbi:hypothetical protein AWZ03_007250 [Drosophila navojoa]|uniref:Uncharacterized protein n=1 Tax=Drosophila navojoa TaxID=7232 RepID=A0A484BF12_DRONA|nr:hypothetical protein AWZ03_007250 [Drosophila navojoa]
MSWILRAIKKCYKGKRLHVTFSTRTLAQDRERKILNMASPIPFQNFLNEVRLIAMDEKGVDHMTLKESASMRRAATRLWGMLTEEQKNRYREIAVNSSFTRLSLTRLMESKSNLDLPHQSSHESQIPSTPLEDVGSISKPKKSRGPARPRTLVRKRKVPNVKGVKKPKKPKKISKPLTKRLKKSIRKCTRPISTPIAMDIDPPQIEIPRSKLGKRRYSNTDMSKEGYDKSETSNLSGCVPSQLPNHNELIALVESNATELPPLHNVPKRRRHL